MPTLDYSTPEQDERPSRHIELGEDPRPLDYLIVWAVLLGLALGLFSLLRPILLSIPWSSASMR